jgi:sugar porter (SP) family MFS transporter
MATREEMIRRSNADEGAGALYLYTIVLVAAVGGFLWGYDLSLISGAGLCIKAEYGLGAGWYGAVTGSAILGTPFGSILGVWMADRFGRKRTLIFAALLTAISTVGCAFAGGVMELIVWRFVGGAGVGLASTVSPMYIAEVAPARLRGILVVVNQLAIVIGLTLSVVVAYFLIDGDHWRWMFATQSIPIVCLLAGLAMVPESPRWLAMVGHHDGALAVLAKINGRRQAETEMTQIKNELGGETGGFAELLRPGIFAAVLIGMVLMVLSQINGVNMILLYTPHLFREAGDATNQGAMLNSIYIDCWITLCTVVSFWLTQKFKRRLILICGTIVMACGHLLMFVNFTYAMPRWFTLCGMFVATGAFTLSLAPLSWVVLSELYPNRVRGKAMSIVTCAMFISSYIAANLFPVVLDQFSEWFGNPGGTFLIFMAICLTCSVFVWGVLPETKDKTLEEIGEYWLKRAK